MVLTYFLVGRSVNDGNRNTATYSYLANSPLVGQIVYANNVKGSVLEFDICSRRRRTGR